MYSDSTHDIVIRIKGKMKINRKGNVLFPFMVSIAIPHAKVAMIMFLWIRSNVSGKMVIYPPISTMYKSEGEITKKRDSKVSPQRLYGPA